MDGGVEVGELVAGCWLIGDLVVQMGLNSD
jgi:hypothetical protein